MLLGLTFSQYWFLVQGAGWTIVLSLLGFVGGTIVGLPVAFGRISKNRAVATFFSAYVQLIQGIPLPVIMFVVYFGLSIYGYNVSALVAAGVAMTLYSSAYLGEIWKGCILAVPKTQWEAGECLALTGTQRFVYIILPQALTIAVPPTVGFLVQIVKNTSYSVVIGFFDLTYSAKILNNATFEPFVVFTFAALLYFIICYPLSVYAKRFEQRLQRGRA
ncbi:amino acid ABC transporter permease [Aureimonas fodinaquatilis]|uniref:Amino acid ABC transporter permease n=1 Tax=Aureimonas fodinaquatilis TaxID=2565783 RepID=A0A5B0DPJ9_9HYPH|nr:amino acid ABC transporter permease [Aureimonas fodinaquatilis]KAA0967942.1 amino acid ABC transporter permease [Aureimonas fodinaquatilis]